MPDKAGRLRQLVAGLAARGVEQAELDAFGDLSEQGEVGAEAVVGGAERVRVPRPDLRDLGMGARKRDRGWQGDGIQDRLRKRRGSPMDSTSGAPPSTAGSGWRLQGGCSGRAIDASSRRARAR